MSKADENVRFDYDYSNLRLTFLTQVDVPLWSRLEKKSLEISVQTNATQCTPTHSLPEPDHHSPTILLPFWSLTPMSVGFLGNNLITVLSVTE